MLLFVSFFKPRQRILLLVQERDRRLFFTEILHISMHLLNSKVEKES